MRNIFLEKSYTKCNGETIPKPLFKKSKLSTSMDQQSKVLCSLFLLHAKVRTVEILKLSCIPLTFTSFLTKKKQKVVWKWSPNLIFCVIFKEKYFCYFLLIDHISLCGCLYWVRYWSMSLQCWTKYLEQNSKTGQVKKSLISTFACFFAGIGKV